MKNILIVVDMQVDFINGTLGTNEAENIVDNAVRLIDGFEGDIFATLDTHFENYFETSEGRKLPVAHCIKGTSGWELDERIKAALDKKTYTAVEKITFGSTQLPALVKNVCGDELPNIMIIGLCTDICVVSNALILKANFPEANISVESKCCAGVTPKLHESALDTMRSCQINVI